MTNKKVTINRYTLCEISIIRKSFDSEIERENFETYEIEKINKSKNSQHFIGSCKYIDEKGKNPALELKIYKKLDQRSSLIEIDKKTLEEYQRKIQFGESCLEIEKSLRKKIIVYFSNGIRTLCLINHNVLEYLDEKFLSDRIYSLMEQGKITIYDILGVHNIGESRDLDNYINKIISDQELCKKYGFDFKGIYSDIFKFIKRVHTDAKGNLQYRRFRDLALYITEIDNVHKLNEAQMEKESKSSKPVEHSSMATQTFSTNYLKEALQIGLPGFNDKAMDPVRKRKRNN